MNFELLYTHSRFEGIHNGEFNRKNMHMEKDITDCNYELHKNICNNKPTFDSAILLLIDHKMHNTKFSRVPPLSSSIEVIFIAS